MPHDADSRKRDLGAAHGKGPAPEWDRLDWIGRIWREVAADYCSHEGVGKSCAPCRGVVSDVADLFAGRTSK